MVHSVVPSDTDPEVFGRQIARWRAVTTVARAVLADRLSVDVVSMASAGIRSDRPDISDHELMVGLVRRRHGAALAKAWQYQQILRE
ncbi:MAG: hypothetical protein ACK5O2_12170 [Microthrixaceae bacterium]